MADQLVLSLEEIRAADAAIAGGKGANLGELIAAGFSVPLGFILTTAAYGVAARSARVDPSDPTSAADRLRAGDVPRAVATAALDAYRSMGGGKVAVRSSSCLAAPRAMYPTGLYAYAAGSDSHTSTHACMSSLIAGWK